MPAAAGTTSIVACRHFRSPRFAISSMRSRSITRTSARAWSSGTPRLTRAITLIAISPLARRLGR
jgi:hypothetical protein